MKLTELFSLKRLVPQQPEVEEAAAGGDEGGGGAAAAAMPSTKSRLVVQTVRARCSRPMGPHHPAARMGLHHPDPTGPRPMVTRGR